RLRPCLAGAPPILVGPDATSCRCRRRNLKDCAIPLSLRSAACCGRTGGRHRGAAKERGERTRMSHEEEEEATAMGWALLVATARVPGSLLVKWWKMETNGSSGGVHPQSVLLDDCIESWTTASNRFRNIFYTSCKEERGTGEAGSSAATRHLGHDAIVVLRQAELPSTSSARLLGNPHRGWWRSLGASRADGRGGQELKAACINAASMACQSEWFKFHVRDINNPCLS
ncbi:hypothetical protein E2562_037384, partial [Oryza meyeriana var. granulata]